MIPAPKTDSIIEQLNSIALGNEGQEFALLSLKRQAEQIREKSVAEGDTLLGMVATIERNFDELHRRFNNAIHYAPNAPFVYSNYSASLNILGLYSRSAKLAQKAWDYGHSIDLLEKLVTTLMHAGEFRRAHELLTKEVPKLIQDKKKAKKILDSNESIAKIYDFIVTKGLLSFDPTRLIETAISVLHRHDIYRFEVSLSIEKHENEEWMVYLIALRDKDYAELICLEDELDEEIEANSLADEHFSIEYHTEDPGLEGMLGEIDSYVERDPDCFVKISLGDLREISEILE